MSRLTFVATGDSFITQCVPRGEEFNRISMLLQKADVRFTNLETVIRQNEGFPAAQSGGTWATSSPSVLSDLQDYGFNLIAWANNHTLDYSYGGLESTSRYLDAQGLVHAGVGPDLEAAAAIKYLGTPQGKVALIAATSTFHESWRAGATRPGVPGRPGVNPLRFQVTYKVLPEKLKQLRATATACGINTYYDLMVKEGFVSAPPEGSLKFGHHLFAAADDGREREETAPHPGDQKRILDAICEAATKADCVLVSIHSHEGGDGHKDQPADFIIQFSRACIEAGAHAVIGHGPHILRGIEIYQGRPIFYSLGNFIFQNELVEALPADFYEQYKLDPSFTVEEALDFRSAGGKRGLAINPQVWHSVIAHWTMESGQLQKLILHPISLGFGQSRETRGTPRRSADLAPLEEIVCLSKSFQTDLLFSGSSLIWQPPAKKTFQPST